MTVEIVLVTWMMVDRPKEEMDAPDEQRFFFSKDGTADIGMRMELCDGLLNHGRRARSKFMDEEEELC